MRQSSQLGKSYRETRQHSVDLNTADHRGLQDPGDQWVLTPLNQERAHSYTGWDPHSMFIKGGDEWAGGDACLIG